jgi:hypothetical protein
MNETPANGGYLIAAYTATALILLGYAISLIRRARRNR